MKRPGWFILSLLLPLPALATALVPSRNGVLRTGSSLTEILNEQNASSLFQRCNRENAGTRLFQAPCRELVDQLQKKMGLLSLESDIQIQSERINSKLKGATHRARIELLGQLNLAATQAEDAIKTLKASFPEYQLQEHLADILPTITRVETAYVAYSKLIPDAQNSNP